MKIRLSKEEVELLSSGQFLPDKLLKKVLAASPKERGIYILEVSADEADEIRDFCGEQLQKTGFDENYNVTKAGHILESLIDKLYVQ